MVISKNLLAELRSDLLGILQDSYSERQLNGVVKRSHAIAITFLKSKIASRRLSLDFLRLNLNDLGYDCIADLFLRDDRKSVVQLKSYFAGLSL